MSAPPARRTALEIGAGAVPHVPGAVRLDLAPACRPDVVADANRTLPFRNDSFDIVGAYDVLEHVDDLVRVVEEVHRVLRPGGVLQVTTPHFSSANAYTDPTHRRALGLRSFDYFAPGHPLGYYSDAQFRVRAARLMFKGAVVGRLVAAFARRWPVWYEDHLAWVFPGWFLYFELEAVK